MSKQLKKLLKSVSTVLILLVALLAILLVGVRLTGLQIFSVLSPSMEPEYPTGSLIYVKEVDPMTLEVGDVITFRLNDTTTATHRIIERVHETDSPDSLCFRTKGDANEIADGPPVYPDSVIGTPVFMIPLLGYLATFIQTPTGTIVSITFAIALVLVIFLIDLITGDAKVEDNSSTETKNKKIKHKGESL